MPSLKEGNWVGLDKALATSFSKIRRQYSDIEAMFSLSLDVNCGKQRSEASYARMWTWSRGKVKRFILTAIQNGQATDRQRTGNGHAYSLLYLDNHDTTDTKRTGNGQATDSKYKEQEQEQEETTTIVELKPRPCIPHKVIIDFLNKEAETNFKHQTKATQGLIKARWREGFRLDDFMAVISHKTQEWCGDEKMGEYIRPQTLFGTKFESYLQAAGPYTDNKQHIKKWVHPDDRKKTDDTNRADAK